MKIKDIKPKHFDQDEKTGLFIHKIHPEFCWRCYQEKKDIEIMNKKAELKYCEETLSKIISENPLLKRYIELLKQKVELDPKDI
jgi:hypothetical protein